MSKSKNTSKQDDIARDYSLMLQITTHAHTFGFASVIDNVVAACEDKLIQWNQRLDKAKKLRKVLGNDYGRN